MLAVIVVTTLSVLFIIRSEEREADQILLLMCETGQRNLDYYFNSVEQSIGKVSSFANKDIAATEDGDLQGHVDRVRDYFDVVAHRTNGVLTYYYRIDPEYSKSAEGFWYTNLAGDEFTEHEVTDLSKYDTSDTSKLVWFTVPKATGEGKWLPPYITDNLDVRVISYNVPIYQRGKFVGVIGIDHFEHVFHIAVRTAGQTVRNSLFYRIGKSYARALARLLQIICLGPGIRNSGGIRPVFAENQYVCKGSAAIRSGSGTGQQPRSQQSSTQ
jgi:hypothetical protein